METAGRQFRVGDKVQFGCNPSPSHVVTIKEIRDGRIVKGTCSCGSPYMSDWALSECTLVEAAPDTIERHWMPADHLDLAVMLRNHRRNALRIRDAVMDGTISVDIYGEFGRLDPFSFIDPQPIREALYAALDAFVVAKERELEVLGVTVEKAA